MKKAREKGVIATAETKMCATCRWEKNIHLDARNEIKEKEQKD